MGRRGPRALLSAALLALTAAGTAPFLDVLRWLPPGSDPVAAATRRPPECLVRAADTAQQQRIEIGRAVFRTPLLLGGTAGRQSIACESCHRSGRGNPVLTIAGVSGIPGTVDVTSAVFGPNRDDGIDNPKPVPDLAGPIDRDPARLRALMIELVAYEFDGRVPPEAVLDGLVAYVAALDARVCPPGDVAHRLDDDLDAAARAVAAAALAFDRDDDDTAALLLAAARTELGRVDERFQTDDQAFDTSRIARASRDLQFIRLGSASNRPRAIRDLAAWRAAWPALAADLRAGEARSLYNPAMFG